MSAPIGSQIPASKIWTGMVVEVGGERIDVAEAPLPRPFSTVYLVSGSGRRVVLRSDEQVKVLGYFNPDR